MLGGVCLNTGTIPSKTLREAVLYLTGLDQREMYGQSYRVKDEITIADLTARTHHVVSRENDVVRSQLTRNRVTILTGTARFTSPTSIEIATATAAAAGVGRRPTSSSPPAPSRPGRRPSSSTSGRSSTRTGSSSWTRCRGRWWWPGPG